MRRWLPVLLIVTTFSLASCGWGRDAETTTATVAPTTRTVPSAAVTPNTTPPEPTANEASPSGCDGAFATEAKDLASRWVLVVSSNGEADEATHVVEFADAAQVFFDGIEDTGCDAKSVAAAASLNLEASVLALPFRGVDQPSNPPSVDQHSKVVREGNALLGHLAVSDARFIALECKERINDSVECTPLA